MGSFAGSKATPFLSTTSIFCWFPFFFQSRDSSYISPLSVPCGPPDGSLTVPLFSAFYSARRMPTFVSTCCCCGRTASRSASRCSSARTAGAPAAAEGEGESRGDPWSSSPPSRSLAPSSSSSGPCQCRMQGKKTLEKIRNIFLISMISFLIFPQS